MDTECSDKEAGYTPRSYSNNKGGRAFGPGDKSMDATIVRDPGCVLERGLYAIGLRIIAIKCAC